MRKGFVLLLILVLTCSSTLIFLPVKAQFQGNVTIGMDGSVSPSNAPIDHKGNTYLLTNDVNGSITVNRNSIVFDGAGFSLHGSGNVTDQHGFNQYIGPEAETAITLTNRINVTIKNIDITGFGVGIALFNSTNCTIASNRLYENNGYPGAISLNNSLSNWITQNDLETSVQIGVGLWWSNSNIVSENRIIDSSSSGILVYGLDNVIAENSIDKGGTGIDVSSSHNTIIANNISSAEGIALNRASNNLISRNIISSPDIGVSGDAEGYNNTIFLNTISGSFRATLGFNNDNNSTFYQNNFINNTRNVSYLNEFYGTPPTYPSPQIRESHYWDNGKQGNYWGDYLAKYPNPKEENNTGTYDTPYAVTPTGYPYLFYDYHPLVERVAFTQNVTALPPWALQEPTKPNSDLTVVVVGVSLAVAAAVAIGLLFYSKKLKNKRAAAVRDQIAPCDLTCSFVLPCAAAFLSC